MSIFRRLSNGLSCGDSIPFYHDGMYHLFFLSVPENTVRYPERVRNTWQHVVSKNLVEWEEMQPVLLPGDGTKLDQDGCWTGSVIYAEGKYHIFYTGYHIDSEFPQTICHAVSDDCVTFEKDLNNPIIVPDIRYYENIDWRDPYIFYNEEEMEYWMLIAARKNSGPSNRRGVVVLYKSKDLQEFEHWGVIYEPWHTNCPECPEMYKMGEYWYLVYSRFSERAQTIYRYSKSPYGPWRTPKFDGKSTHNRRERPVHGHRGGSRGRFYYRITTFEGRPWDARDPYKTTFMALKHEIRLSIWRKQKETPGVEKAPGVSSPQRKESGRSGRDDGELRFWVRPGHPYKAVTSISQAEALAHGLTHLHHLVFAAVLARELDWCAALQDAREDARPWGVVGIGLRSDVWVEVRRDDHRPAVLVT